MMSNDKGHERVPGRAAILFDLEMLRLEADIGYLNKSSKDIYISPLWEQLLFYFLHPHPLSVTNRTLHCYRRHCCIVLVFSTTQFILKQTRLPQASHFLLRTS